MSEWETLPLGNVLTFQRGFDITKAEQSDGPYWVISSSGPKSTNEQFKVEGPGVIIGRKGSLGTVFYSGANYWPHDTTLWVKDFHGNNPKFAYYFLQTMGLERLDAGSSNPSLNRNHIHTIPVLWPSPPVQRRIAGILSAYDDLIENSQRRIKILEEMARRLYREWFVHFRFPGHEDCRLVESPLGEIPEGWEVKGLGEIADNFDRLRKPLSKIQRADLQGPYPYYGAAKVFDYVNDFIFDGEYLLMAEDGSVITSDRAPVLQLVNERFWSNNHTHVLRGRLPCSTHYLYLGLLEINISPYITGAAQPKITQENMNRIPFVCAPASIHHEFDNLVEPIVRQTQVLQGQIQNLRRTRDLILPLLLSGQIDVEAIPGAVLSKP
jgi:type I restriction enzyme, S subunit